MVEIISIDELRKLIESKRDYILLDVRNKDELIHGLIPTAVNLPLPELKLALNLSEKEFKKKYYFPKFKKSDNIITYCRTGNRSLFAAQFLEEKGYNAKNYAGSIWEYSNFDNNVKKYF